MLILIAGPYRSGTQDDPQRIQENLDRLEEVAVPLFKKGYTPIIGEWVALPLMKLAGSQSIGDEVWDQMQYPISHSLLEKCDAIFRIKGESNGADKDVKLAVERGIPVYYNLEEVPDAN